MNWLDAVIAVSVFIFIIKGLQRGFLIGLIELSGLVVAVSIPLLFYIPVGRILEDLGVSPIYSAALSFLIIFFIAISIYYIISERFYRWIPGRIIASGVNKVFGLFTGLLPGHFPDLLLQGREARLDLLRRLKSMPGWHLLKYRHEHPWWFTAT